MNAIYGIMQIIPVAWKRINNEICYDIDEFISAIDSMRKSKKVLKYSDR